eukprot:gb/GFBE01050714.1/.p1 GENE.gb/GFBE01050714.1/~~gb/GFBE01050714.1/.p1  ORF type:complete len:144 (+),score=48.51 gb/GFBE01050714.1/:1-432(+)
MGNSSCCSSADTSAYEQKEIASKETAPGAAKLPDLSPSPEAPKAPAAYQDKQKKPAEDEYAVTLDKSGGQRLGIDVDHQDGLTLLVECINEGLVQDWNSTATEDRQVRVGDRITEVNGIRSDITALVDECKNNQILQLKLRRA